MKVAVVDLAQCIADVGQRTRDDTTVYVAHEGPNINESAIMWSFDCGRFVSRLQDIREGRKRNTVYICREANANELLMRFCQQIMLPVPEIHNFTYLAICTLAQQLFTAYDMTTGHFDAVELGFGIKCIRTADRSRICDRLGKRHPAGVPLNKLGENIYAYQNRDMLQSHGLVNWTIASFDQFGWACVLMQDVERNDFKIEFEDSPLQISSVLSGACDVFYKALHSLQDDTPRPEHVALLQSIGKSLFEKNTIRGGVEFLPAPKSKLAVSLVTLKSDGEVFCHIDSDGSRLDGVSKSDQSVSLDPKPPAKKNNRSHKTKKTKAKKKQKLVAEKLQIQQHTHSSETTREDQSQKVEAITTPSITSSQDFQTQRDTEVRLSWPASSSSCSAAQSEQAKSTTTDVGPQPWDIPGTLSKKTQYASTGQAVFRFDIATLHMKCRLWNCSNLATSLIPTSTICPRCGIYSFVRYCSPLHMYEDMRRHFCPQDLNSSSAECGNMTIPIAVDDMTIGRPLGPVRGFIHETSPRLGHRFPRNIIERHRQAVYRSMDLINDYFVFDDIDHIPFPNEVMSDCSPSAQKYQLQLVRGTGRICAIISLSASDEQKFKFNVALDSCLEMGYAAGATVPQECGFIYDVIVEELSKEGLWNVRMCERVCVQMAFEFGYDVPLFKRTLREVD